MKKGATMNHKINSIHRTSEKTYQLINNLMRSGYFQSEDKAFILLRAVLKTLRDRLTKEEAIQLGSQLPALLRGFYYEGWNLKKIDKIKTKEGFLSDIKENLNGHEDLSLELATTAALKVVLDCIDQGEALDILHQLPKTIQELCPD